MYRTEELVGLSSTEPDIHSTTACQSPGVSLWPVFYNSPRFYSMIGTPRHIRGCLSSPRAIFALGGVASLHHPHDMTVST